MPIYNFLEYSDDYAESSGSLWQFKRNEQNMTNSRNIVDVSINDSSSSTHKSSLLVNPADNGVLEKIVVPLKYLINFFRSLEMPFINCKIHLELSWTNNCVLFNIDEGTKFQIKRAKLYVPAVKNYQTARVHTITFNNKELFWVKMIDVQNGLGIKNIFDLVRKRIYGIFETKNPTKKEFRKCKQSQKEK